MPEPGSTNSRGIASGGKRTPERAQAVRAALARFERGRSLTDLPMLQLPVGDAAGASPVIDRSALAPFEYAGVA